MSTSALDNPIKEVHASSAMESGAMNNVVWLDCHPLWIAREPDRLKTRMRRDLEERIESFREMGWKEHNLEAMYERHSKRIQDGTYTWFSTTRVSVSA